MFTMRKHVVMADGFGTLPVSKARTLLLKPSRNLGSDFYPIYETDFML